MKILSFRTIYLSLILFGPCIFQIVTGIGLFIGDFFIGLFPSVIIYFVWLLLLTIHIGVKDRKRLKMRTGILALTLFAVIPYYWFLVSKIVKNVEYFFRVQPLIMIIVVWLCYTLISSWNYLSKSIYLTNNHSGHSYYPALELKKYFRYFLFFLGGPVTIWWLQPILIKVMKKDAGSDK